jgi:DNA-binding transcriptional LysR family regulator
LTALAQHNQLVLTDRTELSKGQEFRVISPRNWRLADLGAKHAFLLAGLGWGGMPLDRVARDLAEGALVELPVEDDEDGGHVMPMFATYRGASPPGPAGRWFIEQLKQQAASGTAT